MNGRDGDHLITPFQCDLCVFRNLLGRNPTKHDAQLLACICQVNLDALWGRETATVHASKRAITQMQDMWKQLQVPPSLPALGPHPLEDTFGYGVAIAMVWKSRGKGCYADYQQFETIRKLRAGYTNLFKASIPGTAELHTLGGDMAKYSLSRCASHSLRFERFSCGCLSRIGQEVHQDTALSVPVVHALLDQLEQEWFTASDWLGRRSLTTLGSFICIAFCGSFRGVEVSLVDCAVLRSYFMAPSDPNLPAHVIIPLLGRFKGEIGSRFHLTPLAARTSSGIEVRHWVSRLVELRNHDGHQHGPAFCDIHGRPVDTAALELDFLDQLERVQATHPELISADINIHESYGFSRSFRRGATSEARARGVKSEDIDLINWWQTFESAKGRCPRLSMKDHYLDI
jgi:hypothetical protein